MSSWEIFEETRPAPLTKPWDLDRMILFKLLGADMPGPASDEEWEEDQRAAKAQMREDRKSQGTKSG